MHTIPTKGIKVSIPVDLADFPVAAIPPPGTVGAKNMVLELKLETPTGVSLTTSIRCTGLQRMLPAIAAASQGGFFVVQGKLGPNNTLVEAGCVFQQNKITEPAQDAGQMQNLG